MMLGDPFELASKRVLIIESFDFKSEEEILQLWDKAERDAKDPVQRSWIRSLREEYYAPDFWAQLSNTNTVEKEKTNGRCY